MIFQHLLSIVYLADDVVGIHIQRRSGPVRWQCSSTFLDLSLADHTGPVVVTGFEGAKCQRGMPSLFARHADVLFPCKAITPIVWLSASGLSACFTPKIAGTGRGGPHALSEALVDFDVLTEYPQRIPRRSLLLPFAAGPLTSWLAPPRAQKQQFHPDDSLLASLDSRKSNSKTRKSKG